MSALEELKTIASTTAPDRIGPYRVEQTLGAGGMATVFLATSPSGAKVAVKRLHPHLATEAGRQRFLREGSIRVRSPHVVGVLDSGFDDDGVPFLVLERLQGETLAARLARGRLPIAEALRVGLAIARGLEAVHAAGYVHRDVNPNNVILGSDDSIKLLDFGVALPAEQNTRLTAPGMVVGTAPYLAPEQATGEVDLDGRVDVWALGCVLYECLAGVRPFERDSALATLLAVLRDAPEPLVRAAPPMPMALRRLVERALAKEREARFPTMSALRSELEVVASEPEKSANPDAYPSLTAIRPNQAHESRVVALALALGVVDAEALRRGVEASGGLFYGLRGDRAVAVWGAAFAYGDELQRAALALLDLRPCALRIGLVIGHVTDLHGQLAGDAVRAVEALASSTESDGLVVDGATSRALVGRVTLSPVSSTVFAVARAPSESPHAPAQRSSVVGRELERARILDLAARVRDESSSRGLVVVGAAGAGKSALLDDVRGALRVSGWRVLVGRAECIGNRNALAAFRGVVRDLVVTAENGILKRWLGAADDAPDASAARIALWESLEEVAATTPTCLVLEDLHWADDASVALVRDLAGGFLDRPLLVVASTRMELAASKDGNLDMLVLEGLSSDAVFAMAADALGARATREFARRLHAHTGGNALFVEQVLREVAVRDALLDDGFPLPRSVEAAVQARLDRLGAVEIDACRWAALVARGFDDGLLRDLGIGDPGPVLAALRREGLVATRSSPRGVEHRIRHALIGDAIEASLGETRAREMHATLAETLARREDADAEELGEHFVRAGLPLRAVDSLVRAVAHLESTLDLAAASRVFEKLSALTPTPPGAAVYLAAGAAKQRGDYDAFVALTERLRASATTNVDRARAHFLSAARQEAARDFAGAEREAAAAVRFAVRAGHTAFAVRAARMRSAMLCFLGKTRQAAQVVDARRFARMAPDPASVALLLTARALVEVFRGRVSTAIRLYREGVAAAPVQNLDAVNAASAYADLLMRVGAYEEGIAALERCAAQFTRLGAHHWAAMMMLNVADGLTHLGRLADAKLLLTRYAAIDDESLSNARYQARFAIASAEPAQALSWLTSVNTDRPRPFDACALALRSEARRLTGDLEGALRDSAIALAVCDDVGGLPEDEADVFLYRARALRDAGQDAEARRVVARGVKRLRTLARRFDDTALRASFLERVPAHRALLAWGTRD